MRIVVTGGSGLVGRGVVGLLSGEHDVVNLDIEPRSIPGVEFVRADVRDPAALCATFSGARAVVHAAAIPGPTFGTEDEIFDVNLEGTRNVALAAVETDVARIVFISSESVLGFVFSGGGVRPQYLPVDESHPLAPAGPYGRSKLLAEAALARVATDALSVVSLRPPWVWAPEEYDKCRGLTLHPEDWWDGLWAYVHRDDLARAVERALTGDILAGFHAVYVAAPDNGTVVPTRDLVEEYYPRVTLADDTPEYGSLVSSRGAGALLGFAPKMSWRNFL
ncbi:MAG: NAD(P)-dependent oxidoreductase [Candidatus Eisenbacteria bacterium]|nr:NAD(P)-dependent oxidoreductase [Candidatus Eisenbacteria bacterium]